MKHTWNDLEESEKTNLTLLQFPSLLISTLKKRISQEQIVKGFRRACLFPLDREEIKKLETNTQPKKKIDNSAKVAMTSLIDFLSEEKIKSFEAILEGNGDLNKSDESLFAYFFHLKQQKLSLPFL